jgi:DNA-binding CsgD family transcriptional regulator/PAS domain-containing protein
MNDLSTIEPRKRRAQQTGLDPLTGVLSGICEAALEPGEWPRVLGSIAEYVGAIGAAYILTNKQNGRVEWISLAGPSVGLEPDYVTHFAALDPYTPVLDATPGWVRLSECLPQSVLRCDEWYNDFVLRAGVGDILGARLCSSPSHAAIIGLHYGIHQPRSKSAHPARLRGLIGQLSQAARLHVRLNNSGWRGSVAQRALDQLAAALIIADGDARIVELNQAGEDLLRRADGLTVRHGRLGALRAFETAKLTALIEAAAVPEKLGPAIGRMLIGRRDGAAPYIVKIAPLGAKLSLFDRPLAMVLATAPEERVPSAAAVAQLFGLSPAESRLAVALVAGKRLQDIAAETGVRITTLRTQLSAILRKVGANRQADLLRILTRIPVVLSGFQEPE